MQNQSSLSVSGESRLPVASNVSITEKEFFARFEAVRGALVSHARRRVGNDDDEDVVGRVLLVAHNAWKCGRYTDPTEKQGPSAFAGWLFRILSDCCVDHLRRQSRREKHEQLSSMQSPLETRGGFNNHDIEIRWAMLASEDDRAALADVELRHEARQRAALADLDEWERLCLDGRIRGKKLREIQAELEGQGVERGTSKSALSRHISSAIAKCRRVPADLLSAPDMDRYAWRVGGTAVIYRAPLTTGSALCREKHQLSDAGFQRAGR